MTNPRTIPALLAGLAVVAATFPAAAQDQGAQPEVLKRTTKWIARFDKDACHLVAQFGDGDDSVVALFTRHQPGDVFHLKLSAKRWGDLRGSNDVRVDFGPGVQTRRGVALDKSDETPSILVPGLRFDGWEYKNGKPMPAITPEQEASVTGFTVIVGTKRPLRLETGSLGRPAATMRACTDDLIRSWGYDPVVRASLSRHVWPLTPPDKWMTAKDYPTAALQMGRQGVVQFRLDIDAEGKVVGCNVLDRAPPDELAAATCRAIGSRVSFNPALDAAGKPVGSYFISGVRFDID